MELKKDVFQRPLGCAAVDLVQNMAVSFATAPSLIYRKSETRERPSDTPQ